ncbi:MULTISPECIES: alpha/beta hydrolase [Micrococcaceae]|uniref:alpha/beta hydrolase n=1 Tax=Micrococcaceae TaxID=1268 RepID=UPI001CFF76EC|nr:MULTISPECIES: alpha/beta hydrolase [Micrococcaceae]MDJ0352944.1 alpha/beta hydrolase [Pseudarthrobacter sp. PH31-O2]WGZ79734.1 alpha/beta hydrolase [Arthrobacter sp. EM1]
MTTPACQPVHRPQQSGGTFALARRARNVLRRVPVWTWRVLMHSVRASENSRFNTDPITGVEYFHDIDFVGDGIRAHRLDVITPHPEVTAPAGSAAAGSLPVYVYFHGGGWTSGDKASLTKYCASQAEGGMVVVNVNYRMAPRFHMGHVLADANAALAWVRRNIDGYGGDGSRIVLGGDSAGGQIAALLTAASFRPELARHHGLTPAVPAADFKGLVQHCSVVDFSVFFDKGFVLSLDFIRMLMPGLRFGSRFRGSSSGRLEALRNGAIFLSPIEWLDSRFPPVFVTTSERDFFYAANMNFIARLHEHSVPVDSLVYAWDSANTEHTWQQNYRYPESQEVYRRLRAFVGKVA